jgi:hypothetical protein
MEQSFVKKQRFRIVERIAKYKDPERIQGELLLGDVSPYTRYKQEILIPILEDCLNRLNEGQYGICLRCGKGIERRRLELVPAAEHCLKCAEVKNKK